MTATQQRPGSDAGRTDDLLTVDGLTVSAPAYPLVRDVSFAIRPGERVGLIGESGSGKSLTSLAVMGLLPAGLRAEGDVRLAGTDGNLLTTPERRLAGLRGRELAMVFQEPMTSLNPTMRVGAQVAEAITLHQRSRDKRAAHERAVALLDQVHLPDPASAARAYPFQLSGGQRQRVVLAIALANDPQLLICDEPTTALDVTVQARVLALITDGVKARGSALFFITHDLAVVATVCERVLVMYGGRLVESGSVEEVFTRPRHRYTEALLATSGLEGQERSKLPTIPGAVPPAGRFPDGCVFRNRCAHASERCETEPAWDGVPERGFACHHPAEVSR